MPAVTVEREEGFDCQVPLDLGHVLGTAVGTPAIHALATPVEVFHAR